MPAMSPRQLPGYSSPAKKGRGLPRGGATRAGNLGIKTPAKQASLKPPATGLQKPSSGLQKPKVGGIPKPSGIARGSGIASPRGSGKSHVVHCIVPLIHTTFIQGSTYNILYIIL